MKDVDIEKFIKKWFKPRKTINHNISLETLTALIMEGFGEKYKYLGDNGKMREKTHGILKKLGYVDKEEKQEIYGKDKVYNISVDKVIHEYNKRVWYDVKIQNPIYPTDAKILFGIIKKKE